MTRKEAIEMLRNNVCNSHHVYDNALPTIIEALETLIPELAESEDDRIRKELLCHIQGEIDTYDNMISGDYDSRDKEDKKVHSMLKRAIIYLEKQKEQNAIPSRETILGIWELGNLWKENPEEREGLTQLQYIQKYWYEKNDYQKEQKPVEQSEEEQKQIVQWPNLSNCKHDCKTCFARCIYRKEQNEEQKPEPKRAPWTPKFKAGDLFKCNGMSQEAKIYEIKRIEKHGCVTGYWCAQFDTPMNGNVWFSSFEEEYMKPYEPELKEENPAKQNDAAINNEPIPAENQSVDIPSIEWSEDDKTRLKVIVEEMERYVMFKQYGTPLSVDDIDWLKNLPERFNLQPKQEVPKDAETLTAKLVNLLKSYRIGEKTAVDLADRIADTYGVQRYLDGVCDASKQEWSEEDRHILKNIRAFVEENLIDPNRKQAAEECLVWLEFLHPQPKQELSIEKAIQWFKDTFFFQNNSSGRGEDYEITTHDFDSMEEMFESFRKSAEIDEYEIIKKHITHDSLSGEVNKRLKECGWYVTEW